MKTGLIREIRVIRGWSLGLCRESLVIGVGVGIGIGIEQIATEYALVGIDPDAPIAIPTPRRTEAEQAAAPDVLARSTHTWNQTEA